MFGLLKKFGRNLVRLVLAFVGGSILVVLLLFLTAAPDARAAPSPRPLAAITPGTTVVAHTSATAHEMSVYADGRISRQFLTDDGSSGGRNQIDQLGNNPNGTTIAVMFDLHDNAVDVGAQGEFAPPTPITRYTTPDNNYPGYSEDTSVVYASEVLPYQIARRTLIKEIDAQADLALTLTKVIDGNWTRRIKLIFTNTAQTEDLIDFPVLVTLGGSRISYTQTQDAGQDIRFVDPDGTLLAHEIEQWDETGTSYVWVKVPQIDRVSNTDYIWMYYGNPSVPDGQDSESVWANDYRMVYHLADGSGPPGMVIQDSTANSFDGTNHGSAAYNGFIAGARDFDGASGYISLGLNLPVLNGVGQATLSAWVRPNYWTGHREDVIAISVGGSAPTNASRASLYRQGSNAGIVARAPDSQDMNTVDTTSGVVSSLKWHYVVAVISYTGNAVAIYVDGVSQTLSYPPPSFTAPKTSDTNSANSALGSEDDGLDYYFRGQIDEARVAATDRSANWVAAQYASMTDDFITYGGQEDTLAAVGQAVAGAPFSYTIVVTNTGLAEVSGVVVTDVVPGGASYISGGSYLGGSNTVSWTIPSIAASESESVTFAISTCQLSLVNEFYRAITSTQGVSSPHGMPLLTLVRLPTLEAQFIHGPTMGTVGSTIYFTSTSTTDGGPIVAWGWDFGDGDTASGSTTDHIYASAGAFPVTLTVTDTCGFLDTVTKVVDVYPSVGFSDASYTVGESDGSATITVTLNATPIVTATVNYATSNGTAIAGLDYFDASDTLTFTPGTTVQIFTVTISDDAIDEIDETVNLTLSSASNAVIAGSNPAVLTITDDDVAGVMIVESGGSTDVVEGGAGDSYTVELESEPTGVVTITFDTGAQVTGIAAIVFDETNWDVAQTVSVSAVNDAVVEGPHTGTIVHTAASSDGNYDGIGIADVTVNIVDNDVAGVSVSPTTVNVTEGGAGDSYTVVLGSEPTGVVTITFDTGAQVTGIAAIVLDETNWDVAQTVSVSAVDDAVVEGPHTGMIAHTAASSDGNYDGITIADVTVNITDNDTVPGLGIVKTAIDLNGAPLRLGDEVEYQIVVTNGDAFAHTNVLISDWIPLNTMLVTGSESCSPGATCTAYLDTAPDDAPIFGADQPADSGGLVITSMGSLASEQVLTLTFRVRVNPGVLFIEGNVAVVESDAQEPLATSPVCPSAGCTIGGGLIATKVAVDLNGAPLVAGEVVEYRIVVTGAGASVSNVSITDTVPANMTLVAGSVTCSTGASCGEAGGEIVASIGSLGLGDSILLTFQARVDPCVSSVGGNVAAFWSDDQGWQKTLPVYPPGGGVVLPCPADLYEDDDTPAQAVYLQVGSAYGQSHTFCDDSADWNAFIALAGEVYTITTSSWGLGADTFLTVIGTDGVTVLAINDDCPGATDGSSCIVWTAPSSGMYYARTTNRDGLVGCNTEYKVWIESRTTPVHIYLPLVARNYAPADLSMDVSPDVDKTRLGGREARVHVGLGAAPGAVGWLGSGSLLLALLGVPKELNVHRKR